MNDSLEFEQRNTERIAKMGKDRKLISLSHKWMNRANAHEYSYHFSWMGRPIIQYPQDIVAMQEVIWDVKPDMIIETGIARGGSIIFYASMMELLGGDGLVVGIDIDIRKHNRLAIENHLLAKRIRLLEGSSIDEKTIRDVRAFAAGRSKIIVVLDSNHTHAHVLEELNAYSDLVSIGSYLVVFDTIIELMPSRFSSNRPWRAGNNPMTAVQEFLRTNAGFVIDRSIHEKLLISVAPSGYLKRI